jgi:hypothetical protein
MIGMNGAWSYGVLWTYGESLTKLELANELANELNELASYLIALNRVLFCIK